MPRYVAVRVGGGEVLREAAFGVVAEGGGYGDGVVRVGFGFGGLGAGFER